LKTKDFGSDLGVGSALRRALLAHPAFSANPLGDWKELVGEQVARYSQPKSLKKGVLVVVAYDSVWKHHLELNKEVLMEKINSKRSEPVVEKIVIRVGEVPEALPVLNSKSRQAENLEARRYRAGKKKKAPVRPLTPEEKALLKSLPDEDLRRIGARLLKRLPLEE
jgi:hypothetical protein